MLINPLDIMSVSGEAKRFPVTAREFDARLTYDCGGMYA